VKVGAEQVVMPPIALPSGLSSSLSLLSLAPSEPTVKVGAEQVVTPHIALVIGR
jgi:hypothetical protein